MTATRQILGRRGEELAGALLARGGARVIEQNARTRYGELDLIVIEGDDLVFVEVKAMRSDAAAGPERPALAVGARKQAQIRRLAAAWLAERAPARRRSGALRYSGLRFDVIGIRFDRRGRALEYEHIRNAF